jgi:hypothetical protein
LFLYFKNDDLPFAKEKAPKSNFGNKETTVTHEESRMIASSTPQHSEPRKKESEDISESDREAVQDVATAMESLDSFKRRNPGAAGYLASIGATAEDTPTQLIQLSQAFQRMPDYLALQYADMLGNRPRNQIIMLLRNNLRPHLNQYQLRKMTALPDNH